MAEQQQSMIPDEDAFQGKTSVTRGWETWGGKGANLQHSMLNSAPTMNSENDPPCWDSSGGPISGVHFRPTPIILFTGPGKVDKFGDYLERYLIRHFGEGHFSLTIQYEGYNNMQYEFVGKKCRKPEREGCNLKQFREEQPEAGNQEEWECWVDIYCKIEEIKQQGHQARNLKMLDMPKELREQDKWLLDHPKAKFARDQTLAAAKKAKKGGQFYST